MIGYFVVIACGRDGIKSVISILLGIANLCTYARIAFNFDLILSSRQRH